MFSARALWRVVCVSCLLLFPTALRAQKPAFSWADLHPVLQETDAAIAAGDAAASKGDVAAAEMSYAEALALSRKLPREMWFLKGEALRKLSEILDVRDKRLEVERLIEERVELLDQNSAAAGLDLGTALFDLQCHYGTAQLDRAEEVARRAVAFYRAYKAIGQYPAQADRQLADVEGTMGSLLFAAGRNKDSEAWFRSVISRDDEGVRPMIMLVALRAYAKVLCDKGEGLESARIARRSAEFERKHPEAVREIDGSENRSLPVTQPN